MVLDASLAAADATVIDRIDNVERGLGTTGLALFVSRRVEIIGGALNC